VSYDKFADSYDRKIAPLEKRFLDRWRAETLAHLPENARILEIGAGTGLNFKHYPHCRHAVASELSFKMLEIAKTKTASIELVQADAEKLPFPDESFDAAFATLVFCSLPNPEQAFAELRRVLKSNGKIILLEHVRPKGLLGYLFDVLNLFTVALFEDHFNRRTAETAENSGLKILEVKPKAFGIVNLIVCEVEK
jgi:ubiquinone/menaquinone biosynthesis C-methylase UbiE